MTYERPLEGRRALVTGGGVNLGRQMSLALAEAGAEVVVCGRRTGPLKEVVSGMRSAAANAIDHDSVRCDVTDETDRTQLVDEAGAIDILVNNAGYARARDWATVPLEEWREVMEVNLEAPFRLCQLFVPPMVERGWGRVINIASVYGSVAPDPNRYPGANTDVASYVASKHGLVGLTKHLAAMLGGTGVTINSISPGMFVLPESTLPEEAREALGESTPLKRTGGDTDLKAAIAFLASPGSDFVTGHDLVVDGGWTVW